MKTDNQIRASIISDLLAPFPPQTGSDAQTIIAGYLAAIDGLETMYVGEAARRLLNGTIKRGNPEFAPSPTSLAIAARSIRDDELRRQQRNNAVRKQIESSIEDRSPADLAKRRRIVADCMDKINFAMPHGGGRAVIPKQQAISELNELSRRPRQAVEISEELKAQLLGAMQEQGQ